MSVRPVEAHWKWTHHERSQRAFTELTRPQGGSVAIARFGGEVGETSDEHLRVWLDLPDRWRFESADRFELRNGSSRWVGTSAHITELTDAETTLEETDVGIFIRPGSQFFGALRFGEPSEDEVAGRRCWRVDASASVNRRFVPVMPLNVRLGGIDHQFWFDAVTGIVLRHVGMIDDEPCTITEFKDVRVNPPLSDLDFQFIPPPGAVVERQIDQVIRMAEAQGVDLSGVDRDDPHAVQEAFHRSMRHQPTPAARLEMQKAKHVPVGDPPNDEQAARTSIEYAFTHQDEVDASGDGLLNVQGGSGLAGPLHEAQKRIPGGARASATFVVDDILFLRSDEAVVWFTIEINGGRFAMANGREGRAVKIGDRWMIERATVVDLLGMAGVVVPPPS
jgi:hypothetical protein